MKWVLRRAGGLRRVLFLAAAASALLLLSKTFLGGPDDALRPDLPAALHPAHHPPPPPDSRTPKEVKDDAQPQPPPAQEPNHPQPQDPPDPDAPPTRRPIVFRGCGTQCPGGQLAFNATVSLSHDSKPVLCLNDVLIFEPNKVALGLNVIVLDELSHSVEDIKYFALQSSDAELVGSLSRLPGQRLVILLSWGDFSERLSANAREILLKLGGKSVAQIKKGSSLIFVGQKGLRPGFAVEKIGQTSATDSQAAVSTQGCIKIPLGPVDSKVRLAGWRSGGGGGMAGPAQSPREHVQYGPEIPNCGVKDACPAETFAFFAYSGKHKDDEPKMCIDHRFVVGRTINNSGRGLNIAVINATHKDVLRVAHFDTYQDDSSTLEIFLEQLVEGDTIAVVSFDEASNRLSNMAKQMFYELGSGQIQNLKFRASWYFIGQKGINGFTPFEELNFAAGSEWAKPVDVHICVPFKLDGRKVRPDPSVRAKNEPKRNFCAKYDGYEEFCDDAHLDEALTPAPLYRTEMEGQDIFGIPILVVAGLSHNSLRRCLQTLLRQPGLRPDVVLVFFDENYPEAGALASLFGFKTSSVGASASYPLQLTKSLLKVWDFFPNAKEVIVIEEELLLTGDFLAFLAPLVQPLRQDPSLLAVSAWNPNGFVGVSSLPDAVYRLKADGGAFPGLAFLLRKDTLQVLFKGNNTDCCSARVWEGGWWRSELDKAESAILVPDVSRVLRRKSDGLGLLQPRLQRLFYRPRAYSKSAPIQGGWWRSELDKAESAILVPDVSRVLRRKSDGLGLLQPRLQRLFYRPRAYSKSAPIQGGWWRSELDKAESAILVPDVSRVLRRKSDGLGLLQPRLQRLFYRPRAYSKSAPIQGGWWRSELDKAESAILVPDVSRVLRRKSDGLGLLQPRLQRLFYRPRAYSKSAPIQGGWWRSELDKAESAILVPDVSRVLRRKSDGLGLLQPRLQRLFYRPRAYSKSAPIQGGWWRSELDKAESAILVPDVSRVLRRKSDGLGLLQPRLQRLFYRPRAYSKSAPIQGGWWRSELDKAESAILVPDVSRVLRRKSDGLGLLQPRLQRLFYRPRAYSKSAPIQGGWWRSELDKAESAILVPDVSRVLRRKSDGLGLLQPRLQRLFYRPRAYSKSAPIQGGWWRSELDKAESAILVPDVSRVLRRKSDGLGLLQPRLQRLFYRPRAYSKSAPIQGGWWRSELDKAESAILVPDVSRVLRRKSDGLGLLQPRLQRLFYRPRAYSKSAPIQGGWWRSELDKAESAILVPDVSRVLRRKSDGLGLLQPRLQRLFYRPRAYSKSAPIQGGWWRSELDKAESAILVPDVSRVLRRKSDGLGLLQPRLQRLFYRPRAYSKSAPIQGGWWRSELDKAESAILVPDVSRVLRRKSDGLGLLQPRLQRLFYRPRAYSKSAPIQGGWWRSELDKAESAILVPDVSRVLRRKSDGLGLLQPRLQRLFYRPRAYSKSAPIQGGWWRSELDKAESAILVPDVSRVLRRKSDGLGLLQPRLQRLFYRPRAYSKSAPIQGGWWRSELDKAESAILVPDVSRVLRRKSDGLGLLQPRLQRLFYRPRAYSKSAPIQGGWWRSELDKAESAILVPDVSRVLRRKSDGLGLLQPRLQRLFYRPRAYSKSAPIQGGWWRSELDKAESAILVPDVSRVLRRKSDGLGLLQPRLQRLFYRPRAYSKSAPIQGGWWRSELDKAESAILVPDVSRVLRRKSDGLGLLQPRLQRLFYRPRASDGRWGLVS